MNAPASSLLAGPYAERPGPVRAWRVPGAVAGLFDRVAGRDARRVFAPRVRAAQAALAQHTAAWRAARLVALRVQLAREGLLSPALPEAMALVVDTCRRTLQITPYDTQLFAAHIMLEGRLAEMATGEGKTLAAALTAAIGALAGLPVHVMTANDYLVQRDATALAPFYRALGLSVGAVTQAANRGERQAAYACDITYCTAKELVFDYLRDGLAAPRGSSLAQSAAAFGAGATDAAPRRLLRGLHMAIVDEADSILIDEARVPLILSQPARQADQRMFEAAWRLSAVLAPLRDFVLQARTVRLTAAGRAQLGNAPSEPWLNRAHAEELVVLALTARHVLQRGGDYVLEAGKLHLIDATTGRKADGRAWSRGLQQMVELKEGCAASAPLNTLAQITYQRFFPRYLRLCGMSGTLVQARGELRRVYDLAVVGVPLRLPSRRRLLPARVFETTAEVWRTVAASARAAHARGQPVLIGTDTVTASEMLSRCLSAAGLPHQVLNAAQDQHEAEAIARAGVAGAITVTTNMAGRGTDIVLDAASRAAGGLYVMCCQQNAAYRIDRQLLGRAARQGDAGSAQYFIALDGPLLANFAVAKILLKIKLLQKFTLFMGAAAWGLRAAQWRATREQVRERAALLERDERVADWLAFRGQNQ